VVFKELNARLAAEQKKLADALAALPEFNGLTTAKGLKPIGNE